MADEFTYDETPTGGTQAEDHGVQHKTGYGYLPVGETKDICKAKAQEGGAYAWDEHAQACWMIFGDEVKIGPDEHSIQEGFQVVNKNFRADGNQPAVPSQDDLPGAGSGGSQINGAPPGTLMNPGGVLSTTA